MFDSFFIILLLYTLVIEVCEFLGFDVKCGMPTPCRSQGCGFISAMKKYIEDMNIWNMADITIIFLGSYTVYLRLIGETAVGKAIDELNLPGSNDIAYASLISAQDAQTKFTLFASVNFLISGLRFFKYFEVRLPFMSLAYPSLVCLLFKINVECVVNTGSSSGGRNF